MQTPYFKAFFLSFNYPFLTIPNVISSAPRYDLFDTSPYILTAWKNKVYFNTKSKTKSLLIL